MESSIIIDTDDKLRATIQAFLNKGIQEIFLETVWTNVKGIEIFGKPTWALLNRLSQCDILFEYLLPKLSDLNDLFYGYFSGIMSESQIKDILPELIKFSTEKGILFIPIKSKYNKSVHKIIYDKSIILFLFKDELAYTDIQSEERFFFLVHEIGHAILHYHYQCGLKAKDRQSVEYILFNENMAWYTAHDLLKKYSWYDPIKLRKLQEDSLCKYMDYYDKGIEDLIQ